MLVEHNEPQINFDSLRVGSDSKRRFQLLFALVLLLTALVLVVLKNRQFWFDALGLEVVSDQTASDTISKSQPQVGPAHPRKAGTRQTAPSLAEPHTAASTERQEIFLNPLQVDVTYSSGQHQTIVANNSALHMDLQNSQQSFVMPLAGVSSAAGTETGVAVAPDKVRFASQNVELLGHPVEPVYPPLAQRANVQGSVVLQARIGEDGNVQSLQVISGPSILTTAALEAVKQWHFKPRLEAGKAVPTETRITVNFTISTQ